MKTSPQKDKDMVQTAAEAAAMIEQAIIQAERKIEARIDPLRSQVGRRFPTLFILLSTFGLIATYLAMEQLLLRYNITQENPELLLLFGIGILVFTGTLYKKLG